jgi:hypothetical protein
MVVAGDEVHFLVLDGARKIDSQRVDLYGVEFACTCHG